MFGQIPWINPLGIERWQKFNMISYDLIISGPFFPYHHYPLVKLTVCYENGRRNSGVSDKKWWFSIVFGMFTRGYILYTVHLAHLGPGLWRWWPAWPWTMPSWWKLGASSRRRWTLGVLMGFVKPQRSNQKWQEYKGLGLGPKLVGGLEHEWIMTFHILGISSSQLNQLTNSYFSEG